MATKALGVIKNVGCLYAFPPQYMCMLTYPLYNRIFTKQSAKSGNVMTRLSAYTMNSLRSDNDLLKMTEGTGSVDTVLYSTNCD
uniref:Expressed protein n=1 Tax=Echinococcus granulosus TaxID=6210 RepID=A0A068WUK4_ECHGR|nr:expressed protein [Echinococcus granulosus]